MTAVDPIKHDGLPARSARRLAAYLADRLGTDTADIAIERIKTGHSNLTFGVSDGSARYVLRRPPDGLLPPSAHDVLREFRVLSLLEDTGARIPRPLFSCADTAIIGVPFYVMEHIDGFVLREQLPPDLVGADAPRVVGEEVVHALGELHAVDWRAAGFDTLAPPDGYLGRQLRLWRRQWAHNRTRDLPAVERLGDALERTMPRAEEVTVVHGDYKLDNLIFASIAGAPRARAILDWEMATLGDPLADVGYLTAVWSEPGEDPTQLVNLSVVTATPGFDSRATLARRYARRTGRDLGRLPWYQALALWKLAILLEGSYKRHLAGLTDDPWLGELEAGVPALMERAREITL